MVNSALWTISLIFAIELNISNEQWNKNLVSLSIYAIISVEIEASLTPLCLPWLAYDSHPLCISEETQTFRYSKHWFPWITHLTVHWNQHFFIWIGSKVKNGLLHLRSCLQRVRSAADKCRDNWSLIALIYVQPIHSRICWQLLSSMATTITTTILEP